VHLTAAFLYAFATDFREMITVNCQSDRLGHQTWAVKLGPTDELPVLETIFPDNPQMQQGAKISHLVLEAEPGFDFRRVVFPEKGLYPSIVILRRIDIVQERFIAIP